jgi:hypothetical protein
MPRLADLEYSEIVALANRQVAFPVAARLAGMEDVPEPKITGSRAFCPFGEFSHQDSGWEKALRVYPDHGYCFAESLYLSPVKIYQMMKETSPVEAARQLLSHVGYREGSWEQRWDELLSVKPEPDYGALAAALRIHLEVTCADWGNRQLDPFVAQTLARCLGLLTQVHSEQDCREWLDGSVQVMAHVLGGHDG